MHNSEWVALLNIMRYWKIQLQPSCFISCSSVLQYRWTELRWQPHLWNLSLLWHICCSEGKTMQSLLWSLVSGATWRLRPSHLHPTDLQTEIRGHGRDVVLAVPSMCIPEDTSYQGARSIPRSRGHSRWDFVMPLLGERIGQMWVSLGQDMFLGWSHQSEKSLVVWAEHFPKSREFFFLENVRAEQTSSATVFISIQLNFVSSLKCCHSACRN